MRTSWRVGGSVAAWLPQLLTGYTPPGASYRRPPAVVTLCSGQRNATASFGIAETAFVACVAIRAICPRCVAAFQLFRLFGASLVIHLMIAGRPASLPACRCGRSGACSAPAGQRSGRNAAWYHCNCRSSLLDASRSGTASLALGSRCWVLQWAVSERDERGSHSLGLAEIGTGLTFWRSGSLVRTRIVYCWIPAHTL